MYLGDKEKRKKIKQKIVSGCIGGLVGMAVLCTLFSAFPFEKKGEGERVTGKSGRMDSGADEQDISACFCFYGGGDRHTWESAGFVGRTDIGAGTPLQIQRRTGGITDQHRRRGYL